MNVSRRNFLLSGLATVGYYMTTPEILTVAASAATYSPRQAGKGKVLVVVQLGGGNDGLNTVVPYGIGAYYDVRPYLAIKDKDVLRLDRTVGLHPSMTGLSELYKAGQLAIVQGVGYPNPNRSHFRSIEIWQTAQPDRIADTGWLGRYLDHAAISDKKLAESPLPAVNVDPLLPKTLSARSIVVPSVNNVNDFRFKTDPRYGADRQEQIATFKDIYEKFDLNRPHVDLLRRVGLDASEASDNLLKIVKTYKSTVEYPKNGFAGGLKLIAQMIAGGVDAKIYNISLDGFDTHSNQVRMQGNLLKQLSDGLYAFQKDLVEHAVDKDVIVLCFSEFGRRVAENGARGTDHGTAEPLFVIGTAVKSGIYGDHPSLSRLDEGDLRYKIDFRTVYATILDKWLSADSRAVLGTAYSHLPILA